MTDTTDQLIWGELGVLRLPDDLDTGRLRAALTAGWAGACVVVTLVRADGRRELLVLDLPRGKGALAVDVPGVEPDGGVTVLDDGPQAPPDGGGLDGPTSMLIPAQLAGLIEETRPAGV